MDPFSIAIVAVLVIVPIVYFGGKAVRRRTVRVGAVAERLGFAFSPKDDAGLRAAMGDFQLFKQGHTKRAYNLIHGRRDDAKIVLFDFDSVSGGGKTMSVRSHTVGYFQSDSIRVPEFVLRPATLFDRLGNVLGLQEINLPSRKGASKGFVLKGVDASALQALFEGELAGLVEHTPGLSIEAHGDRFIVYQASRRLPPDQWADGLKLGSEILRIFKASVGAGN